MTIQVGKNCSGIWGNPQPDWYQRIKAKALIFEGEWSEDKACAALNSNVINDVSHPAGNLNNVN